MGACKAARLFRRSGRTCLSNWAAPGRSQVRVRPLSIYGATRHHNRYLFARALPESGTISGRARFARTRTDAHPHVASSPLAYRTFSQCSRWHCRGNTRLSITEPIGREARSSNWLRRALSIIHWRRRPWTVMNRLALSRAIPGIATRFGAMMRLPVTTPIPALPSGCWRGWHFYSSSPPINS